MGVATAKHAPGDYLTNETRLIYLIEQIDEDGTWLTEDVYTTKQKRMSAKALEPYRKIAPEEGDG